MIKKNLLNFNSTAELYPKNKDTILLCVLGLCFLFLLDSFVHLLLFVGSQWHQFPIIFSARLLKLGLHWTLNAPLLLNKLKEVGLARKLEKQKAILRSNHKHIDDDWAEVVMTSFFPCSLVHFWQITKYSREPILTLMWTVATRSDNCNGHIIDSIFICHWKLLLELANHSREFWNIDQKEVDKQDHRDFWNDGVIFINRHELKLEASSYFPDTDNSGRGFLFAFNFF